MKKKIAQIAEKSFALACAAKKTKECPYFAAYADRHGILSRKELDRRIYTAMYGQNGSESKSESGLQRIRFWRLGRHAPVNRQEAIRLSEILTQSPKEQNRFLTQQWEFVGLNPPEERERSSAVQALFRDYLCRIDNHRLQQLSLPPGTQEKYVRHIFFSDVADCISMTPGERSFLYKDHSYSRGMRREFLKYFETDEPLSRDKMMKMLLIVLMPDVDRKVFDDYLVWFGYGGLNPDRFLSGARDYAVGELLDYAQEIKTGDLFRDKIRMKKLFAAYDEEVKNLMRELGQKNALKERDEAKKLCLLRFRGMEAHLK